jgi:hypothetical protein
MYKRKGRLNTDEISLLKNKPVEKSEEILDELIAKQSDKRVISEMPRKGGVPADGRPQSCRRQVYATQEVAEMTVARLRKSKILGEIERCKFCGFLHIKELRMS